MIWRNVLVAACIVCLSGTARAAIVRSVETDKAPPGATPGDPYNPTFPSAGPSSIDVLAGVLPIDTQATFKLRIPPAWRH